MACGGHCNVCPSHPGYTGPGSPVTWYSDPVDTDIVIKGLTHFYYLAYEIDVELDRRGDTPFTGWWVPITDCYYDDVAPGKVIYAEDWITLRTGLVDAANGWTSTYCTNAHFTAGQPILAASMNEMRDKLDALRAECLCNCNYSCTCNCNYCTCNCNYACTCNCNY